MTRLVGTGGLSLTGVSVWVLFVSCTDVKVIPAFADAPPVTARRALTGCGPSLPVALCQQLLSMGVDNVMCPIDPTTNDFVESIDDGGTGVFASPSDDCDDTQALSLHIDKGRQITTLLPSGTGAYRISSPLKLWAQRFVGELGTRIAVMPGASLAADAGECWAYPPVALAGDNEATAGPTCGTGAMVWALGTAPTIESLRLDGSGSDGGTGADYGIYLFNAHGTHVTDVNVTGTRRVAVATDRTLPIRAFRVTAEANAGIGFMLLGSSLSTLREVAVVGNGSHGIVISTRPSSLHTGAAAVLGGRVEGNGAGAGAPAHGIVVWKQPGLSVVERVLVRGNTGDGVLTVGAQNIRIIGNVIDTGSLSATQRPIRLAGCSNCVVEDNGLVGGAEIAGSQNIVSSPDSLRFLRLAGNLMEANGTLTHAEGGARVVLRSDDDAGRTFFETQHHSRHERAAGPPDAGVWRNGDIVWNGDPAAGQAAGWICKEDNVGGCAWLAIGSLAP